MTLENRHYKDEIQDLIDDRLDESLRGEVEDHLETCEACRNERQNLQWVKEQLRTKVEIREVPPDVQAAVAKALDDEDRETTPAPSPWWKRHPIAVAASILLVFLAVLSALFLQEPDLPSAAAADFRHYRQGDIALERTTESTTELESFFRQQGISFETRVFDLGMMDYAVVGGRVLDLAGRQSAFFVYRSSDGKTLVCRMYEGHTRELPTGAELRENDDIVFHIYRDGDVTTVFWQEGDVTCVLVSDIAAEEVIQLAFAKAVKIL